MGWCLGGGGGACVRISGVGSTNIVGTGLGGGGGGGKVITSPSSYSS